MTSRQIMEEHRELFFPKLSGRESVCCVLLKGTSMQLWSGVIGITALDYFLLWFRKIKSTSVIYNRLKYALAFVMSFFISLTRSSLEVNFLLFLIFLIKYIDIH